MRQNLPGITTLRALARGAALNLSTADVALLVPAGLGPLLHANAATPEDDAPNLLKAADLTARVITDQISRATNEILRAASAIADQLVLLKGVAASRRHYPAPHQRLMGDIDILVPCHLLTALENALRSLGYTQRSEFPAEFYATHHHSMPFFHARTGIWVEVHTDLLPTSNPAAHDACFSRDHVWANTVPMVLDGVPARTLSDELHLLYTCTHWASVLNIERGLVPIVDVLFLLRTNDDIHWDRITLWLRDSPSAAVHLALMLGYLSTRNVVVLGRAASDTMNRGLHRLGRINANLLYRMVDAFIVGRKQFGRFATHYNTLLAWGTLLRPAHPLRNLAALPLLLTFPPGRTDRFSAKLTLRRLWAVIRS